MKLNISEIQYGTVESIDDPNFAGRIKVRINGINDNIPVNQLPWATFIGSGISSGNGSGSLSIPKVGSKVRVHFKNNDINSIEWSGAIKLDKKLSEEIADDYQGTQVLLYDSDSDLSIIFQPNSGLRIYYKGSNIQISPDGTITLHYGDTQSGTNIQLSDSRIDIQAPQEINLTSNNDINIEAKNIVLNGTKSVSIKGNKSGVGQCAVNGNELISILNSLATLRDQKIPNTAGVATSRVTGSKELLLNQNIEYI